MARLGVVTLLLGLLAGSLVSGCLGGGEEPLVASASMESGAGRAPVRILEDPEGDAFRRIDYVGVAPVMGACYEVEELHPALQDCWASTQELGAQLQPAPDLDVLGLSIGETPETVVVELELARVPEDLLAPTMDGSEIRFTTYYICLGAVALGDGSCMDGNDRAFWVVLQIFQAYDDVNLAAQSFLTDPQPSADCPAGFCYASRSGFEWVPGEPGTLVWTIPRLRFPGSDLGERLVSAEVWADEFRFSYTDELPSFVVWFFDPTDGPVPDIPVGAFTANTYGGAEHANVAIDLTFQTRAHRPDAAGRTVAMHDTDLYGNQDRPEGDILQVVLDDTPDELRVATQLAGLTEASIPVLVRHWLEFEGGTVLRPTATVDGGLAWPESTVCGPSEETFGWCDTRLVSTAEVALGEPAWVNITIDRSDLPDLEAGTLLVGDYFSVFSEDQEGELGPVTYARRTDAGPVRVLLETSGSYAWADHPLYPFVTRYASVPGDGGTSEGASLLDQPGDAVAPTIAATEPGAASGLDLTFVDVRSTADGASEVTIGLAGALGEDPPWGADGYAIVAGMDRPEGPVTIGYYEGSQAPSGEYFCAPDALLFSEPVDPGTFVRTELDGKRIAAAGARSGGGVSEAAFVIDVPHDLCFGTSGSQSVEASTLAAGTFLVQGAARTPGEPATFELDRAEQLEPFSLAGASSASPTPWYRNEAFWLVGLVAVFVVGQVLVLASRRRHGEVVASEEAHAAYRAMVQDGLTGGASTEELMDRLKPLRATMGISDREHARVEGEVRTLLAGTTGAARGLVPGEVFLDRYEVVRPLAAGGAAQTYLCSDLRLDRNVVFKVLRAPGGTDGLSLVLREARAFARLRHPNVVTLLDIEAVGDEAYLVLELVDGGSLGDHLAQGPLAPPAMLRLGEDLLAGLAAVHAAGIVHRDVKPANVLVTKDGRFKLADFGIAHLPGYEETIAVLGPAGAIGTLRYMSPEQARGERVDARSDLYSAALTLYEAWTGVAYFAPREGESLRDVQLRAASGRGSLAVVRRAPLKAFFERALALDPEDRFPSAERMRIALLDALRGAEAPRGAPRRQAE